MDSQAAEFTPDYWNLDTTLPIQLCDLTSFVAAYALWTHRWWAAGPTCYWGLTLTIQAIVTPDLNADFPHPVFFLYWGMHIAGVLAALYLTRGRGVTPTWRSYRFAVLATATWAALVLIPTGCWAPTTATSTRSRTSRRSSTCWGRGRGTSSPRSPSSAPAGCW